jgi:hypothetical protein
VTRAKRRIPVLDFLRLVHWLDGTPILPRIEAYRRRILTDVLDTPDDAGGLRYNLALLGRAKKNAKSLDLVLAALFAWLRQRLGARQRVLRHRVGRGPGARRSSAGEEARGGQPPPQGAVPRPG